MVFCYSCCSGKQTFLLILKLTWTQCVSSCTSVRVDSFVCTRYIYILDMYSGSRRFCYSPSQIHQWQVLCPRVPGGKLSPAAPMGISPHRYINLPSPCKQSAFINNHLLGNVFSDDTATSLHSGVLCPREMPCELDVLPPDALCPCCKNEGKLAHGSGICYAGGNVAAAVMLHVQITVAQTRVV